MKCLGGRLSDSGSRSGHICDGANPTRIIDRGNGTNATGLGNPVALQPAHAKKQQPPLQLRSDAGSVPACPHWARCSDAGVAGRSDA